MPTTTRRIYHATLTLLAGAVSLVGCSDGSPTQEKFSGARVQLSVDNSTGSAVLLDQQSVSLQTGYGTMVTAKITDAAGNTIAGARPTWLSTQPNIAKLYTVPDSGFALDGSRQSIGAHAPGVALVIASYNGVADTVTVTVEQGTVGIPNPPQPITKFDITARAVGFTGGTDSLKWTFTPVPGTVVTFMQLPAMQGDTIPSTVTPVTVPTERGRATVDVNGMVTFTNMPAARFRLDVTTPDASVWASRSFNGWIPYYNPVRVDVLLQKK